MKQSKFQQRISSPLKKMKDFQVVLRHTTLGKAERQNCKTKFGPLAELEALVRGLVM